MISTRYWRWILPALLLPIFVAALLLWQMLFGMAGGCHNSVIHQTSSPSGQFNAVLFQRDCGATTGFSTQLSILGQGQLLDNQPGNLFIAKGHPQQLQIRLHWNSNHQLEITRPGNTTVYKALDCWSNRVTVLYRQDNNATESIDDSTETQATTLTQRTETATTVDG